MEKYFPCSIMIVAGLMRLIPHTTNFSSIYGGVNFLFSKEKKTYLATIITIIVLYLSDLALSLFFNKTNQEVIYSLYGWWLIYVYPTHLINGFISKLIVKDSNQWVQIGVTCSLTSFNFFWLSNLGYFLLGQSDISGKGLSKVYTDAIPFFPMQVLSNFVFTYIFFLMDYVLFRNQRSTIVEKQDLSSVSSEALINSA